MHAGLIRTFSWPLPKVDERGAGLIEVMLAVLVFSSAMTGILAFQIQGTRASSAALQRSVAVLLSQDILARIHANPGEVERYTGNGFGGDQGRQPLPVQDCEQVVCNQADLAIFDIWQWESLLLGATGRSDDRTRGRLHLPTACISHERGRVNLQLAWRGAGSWASTGVEACELSDDNLYDDPSGPPGNRRFRSVLVVSTLIERPAG